MTPTATDGASRLRSVPCVGVGSFTRAGQVVHGRRRLGELVARRPEGITGHQWSSATREEFDHVVCAVDSGLPRLAVSIAPTAPTGSPRLRAERMRDAVCAAIGLPVLRIESPTLRAVDHGRPIVAYVLDAHDYAAAVPVVGPDAEVLDPPVGFRDIVGRLPDGRRGHVNDLGALARADAVAAYVSRRLADPIVRGLHVRWGDGAAEGWSWIEVRPGRCLVERVIVREHRFRCGVDAARFAEDLAALAVGERLRALETDEPALVDRSALRRQIRALRERRDELADDFAFDHLCAD
ncbi:hypothetical protein [Micromonospora sp. KC723]|uniref:hypothetical protein n=1 Tax=Micromonospora sp. KC723 TaxID=2530381 RepID=UPI00104F42A9|nr:hypothetical protein [Micromonospora sp. KC723]TDB77434.1 hypothetical protein E1165_03895 [Micromonospora sp. KC723]